MVIAPAAPVPVAPALPAREPSVPALPEDVAPAPPVLLPPLPVVPAPPSLEAGVMPPQWTRSTANEAKQATSKLRLSNLLMIQIIGMATPDRNRGALGLRRVSQTGARSVWKFLCLRGVAVLVALTAPIGCKGGAPASAPVAPTPATPPTAPAPPVAAAKPSVPDVPPADAKAALAWIDALRERDPGAVLAKTVVPFDFRDMGVGARKKKCVTRAATTRTAAAGVATCLAKDERFHADLSATPEPRLVAVDAASLPPWAKPWAKTLRPGLRPISTFVHGEDEARELVLLVGDDGVRGLWQNVIVEPK